MARRYRVAYLAVAWAVVLASCTVRRHRQAESHVQSASQVSVADHVAVTQVDTLQELWLQRRSQQQELIAIAPVGKIQYHPDSGFAGLASQVVVYRTLRDRTDSLGRSQGARSAQTSVSVRDSASNAMQAGYQQASTVSTPVPWYWVVGGLLCLGLALLGWRYLRRRFFR